MKLTAKPIERVNARIAAAHDYLGVVGWTRATHANYGEPTDIVGALYHCQERDGYEVVASRLLAEDGFTISWNDLECQNLFEAKQALELRYTNAHAEKVYGTHWYGLVGIMRLLSVASHDTIVNLAEHVGPADEDAIASLMERLPDNPAYEDAHIAVSRHGFDRRVWMLTDALVAHVMNFPDVDEGVMVILAPVAEKLGL